MKKSLVMFIVVASTAFTVTARAQEQSSSAPKKDVWEELRSEAPQIPAYAPKDALPLEWESAGHPERKLWSEYLYGVVNQNLDKLDQADDINQFCQNYDQLDHDQKVQAWASLFVGVSHWESSWNPANHTFEDKALDPVTHKPVYSEGLLQLSYQDKIVWKGSTCPFDWEHDKKLKADDYHRTILNPFTNLACGVTIMAGLVDYNKTINHQKKKNAPGYWSTLSRTGYMHSKVKSVAAATSKSLPFCGPPLKGQKLQEVITRFANLKFSRKFVTVWRTLTTRKHEAPESAQSDSNIKRDDLDGAEDLDMEFASPKDKKSGGSGGSAK